MLERSGGETTRTFHGSLSRNDLAVIVRLRVPTVEVLFETGRIVLVRRRRGRSRCKFLSHGLDWTLMLHIRQRNLSAE